MSNHKKFIENNINNLRAPFDYQHAVESVQDKIPQDVLRRAFRKGTEQRNKKRLIFFS